MAAFRGDALKRVTIALIPALVLIVGVLGSIFAGIASPTEAASVGAAGGLILTILKGRFSMPMLKSVMEATTRITSLAFSSSSGRTASVWCSAGSTATS